VTISNQAHYLVGE